MGSVDRDESLDWRGASAPGTTGWPCVDLVNSIEWLRLRDQVEFLRDYGDFVRWARCEGLLADDEARHLLEEAARRPREAVEAHERVIGLRKAMRGILSAVANRAEPPTSDLDALNAELARVTVPVRIVHASEVFRREWLDPKDELGWMLGPIARSAAELLTSPELERLKECPGSPGRPCGELFFDETRNRSRRWCSGSTCGNRTRLYRHYSRIRDHDPEAGA